MKKAIFLLLVAIISFAEVPQLINYQGKLTDPDGMAIDVPTDITFRIYDDPGAGTLRWSESHVAVTVNHGLFDVVLGSTTPLDLPFDEQYWVELEVDGEVLSPRQPLTSAPYALRAAYADSLASTSGGVVTSLNTLTGALTLISDGGIHIDTSGSTIRLGVTLDPGDCSGFVTVGGESGTNSNIPIYLGGFTEAIGQFVLRQSDIGCTGGRIYSITFYSTRTGGSIADVDVWLNNVLVPDLSTGSIIPSGDPTASGATINFAGDGTTEILFPYGFWYDGDNLLITLRRNDGESGLSPFNWKGDATAYVSARYNNTSASFPLTSTANFRPKVKFDFRTPPMPDIVTDVNGITGSIDLIGGTDIEVITGTGELTINYTGSGGTGGFQQLRANGSPWLTDSVTFVEGTNITLSQIGDSITISAIGGAGDNWGTDSVNHDATLRGSGRTTNLLGIAQQGATTGQVLKWSGTNWLPDDVVSTTYPSDTIIYTTPRLSGIGTTGNPLDIAPQSATLGQVLKWNGTTWLPDDIVSTTYPSDTVIYTTPRLSGIGTTGNPLDIAQQGAGTGQVLKWSGTAWTPDEDIGGGAGDNWGTDSVNHNASLTGSGKTSNPLAVNFAGSGTALTAAHSDHTHEAVGPGDIAYADSTGAVAWSDISGIPPIIEDTIPLGKGLSLGADDSINVNVRGGLEIAADSVQIKAGGITWAHLSTAVKDSIHAGGPTGWPAIWDSVVVRLNSSYTTYKRIITVRNTAAVKALNVPIGLFLNSANFNFAHARPDGGDIRFKKTSDATALDYFVSLYDASSETARVWFMIDSIGSKDSIKVDFTYGSPLLTTTSLSSMDTVLYGQVVWDTTWDGGAGDDYAYDVVENPANGRIYITGKTYQADYSCFELLFQQYDSLGNRLNSVRYESEDNRAASGNGIDWTSDGYLAIAGEELDTFPGRPVLYRYWTLKLNTSGTIQWARDTTYSSSYNAKGLVVAADNAGRIITTGYAGSSSSANRVFTVGYSSSGSLNHYQQGPGSVQTFTGYEICADSSGNSYVSAYYRDGTAYRLWLLSYSSSGTNRYTNKYYTVSSGQVPTINGIDSTGLFYTVLSNGKVYVANASTGDTIRTVLLGHNTNGGHLRKNGSFVTLNTSGMAYVYDRDFNRLWQFDPVWTLNNAYLRRNGDVIACGYSRTGANDDVFLVKYRKPVITHTIGTETHMP